MTWPAVTPIDTTDADADSDNPLLFRQDILDAMQRLNAILGHISTFSTTLFDDVDAPAWRATLGLGDAAVQNTTAFWSTGDVKVTLKTSPDTGWVMMNDGTIGNAASAATTRANADTVALFTLLWNNTVDANCAVSGGRGASAAADYAANKTIALPKVLGRALAVSGTGSGLTARALALAFGEENHVLTQTEMPSHVHTQQAGDPLSSFAQSGSGAGGRAADGTASANGPNTLSAGSGGGHNNMQPTSFLNVMIKL